MNAYISNFLHVVAASTRAQRMYATDRPAPRKPLTSASGPAVTAGLKEIIHKGKKIDAEKALRKETKVNGVPSLVPNSWQLISRSRQGVERVLAINVVSYDITAEGRITYSNGRGVFLLGAGEQARLILKSDLVADVAAGRPTNRVHATLEDAHEVGVGT